MDDLPAVSSGGSGHDGVADLQVSSNDNSTEHSKKSDTEHCVENRGRLYVAHDMAPLSPNAYHSEKRFAERKANS
jgi:hypothetical protein